MKILMTSIHVEPGTHASSIYSNEILRENQTEEYSEGQGDEYVPLKLNYENREIAIVHNLPNCGSRKSEFRIRGSCQDNVWSSMI